MLRAYGEGQRGRSSEVSVLNMAAGEWRASTNDKGRREKEAERRTVLRMEYEIEMHWEKARDNSKD